MEGGPAAMTDNGGSLDAEYGSRFLRCELLRQVQLDLVITLFLTENGGLHDVFVVRG